MNILVPAIALVLLLAGATLLVVMILSARNKRRAVERRIDLVAAVRVDRARTKGLVARWITQSEIVLQTIFSFSKTPNWGTHSGGLALLLFGLVGGAAIWFMARSLLALPVWAALPLSIAAVIGTGHFKLSREQGGADARFTDTFPDAIDSIIRMLRAGLPISSAIRAVATDSTPPVDTVFRSVADQMDIGRPLEEALANAGQRIHLADFRFFAVAVALQHSTGGNLTTTLDILSEIIRKRRAMRLKASAVTAEVRMSSYVLAAIPLVIVAGLLVVNPGYLSPMIHDRRGNWIVAAAIASLTTGFLVMRKMMQIAIRI